MAAELNNAKARMAMQEIGKAVIGKDDCIFKVMTAILAGGHILLEDIPGVGKTTMALAFSRGDGLEAEQDTVHAGCASGGYYGVFHVSEGYG